MKRQGSSVNPKKNGRGKISTKWTVSSPLAMNTEISAYHLLIPIQHFGNETTYLFIISPLVDVDVKSTTS